MKNEILARVRFDYKASGKTKFLFGGKSSDKMAEEIRESQVAKLRNLPFQGITVEDIDIGIDIYTVYDELTNAEVSYAPVLITLKADSLEDLIRFVATEEFKKIEIFEPQELVLNKNEAEKMIFRLVEEINRLREFIEKKYLGK